MGRASTSVFICCQLQQNRSSSRDTSSSPCQRVSGLYGKARQTHLPIPQRHWEAFSRSERHCPAHQLCQVPWCVYDKLIHIKKMKDISCFAQPLDVIISPISVVAVTHLEIEVE